MNKLSLLLAGLALVFLAAAPDACGQSPAEKKGLSSVAKAYAGLAGWCLKNKLPERGMAAADAGLKAVPGDKKLSELQEELDALSEEDDEANVKKYERERDKTYKKIIKTYQKLYRLKPAKDVPSRFYDYMVETIRLLPGDKRAWGAYVGALSEANAKKDWAGVGRLAAGAGEVGPPKSIKSKLLSILVKIATSRPLLMKVSGHPMVYYLSLPKGYTPRKKWNLLVTCEGAGCGFLGNHRRFVSSRGSDPLVIITPHTFSTTNTLQPKKYTYSSELVDRYQSGPRITFDEEGILGAVKDAGEMFNLKEKFYITGFSGGGNPTYLFTFKHPTKIAGAIPCCGNFSGQGLQDVKPPTEGTDVRVNILTGANDPHREWTFGKVGNPGIEPQTDKAEELLKKWGYSNYTRTMLPGVKHSALQKQVIEFIRGHAKK